MLVHDLTVLNKVFMLNRNNGKKVGRKISNLALALPRKNSSNLKKADQKTAASSTTNSLSFISISIQKYLRQSVS